MNKKVRINQIIYRFDKRCTLKTNKFKDKSIKITKENSKFLI